jgi:SAM-dependent methyltransferase
MEWAPKTDKNPVPRKARRTAGPCALAAIISALFSYSGFAKTCPELLSSTESAEYGDYGSFGMLEVRRRLADGTTSVQQYDRTNRKFDALFANFYIPELWENLGGKSVLDVGCGGGALVTHLSAEARPAYRPRQTIGLDLLLPKHLKDHSNFVQASVTKMLFANEQFDYVLSSVSFFTYERSPTLLAEGIEEVLRVLKVGGEFHTTQTDSLLQVLATFGDRIEVSVREDWFLTVKKLR